MNLLALLVEVDMLPANEIRVALARDPMSVPGS